MKKLMPLLCVATLASCASPYVAPPPDLKPPALWSGEAKHITLSDSPGLIRGIRKQGEVFYEERTDVTRTGTILDEIKYKDPFGKEIIIPKGTLVHAKQLSVMQTYSGGYTPTTTTNLNAKNDPIEWCYSIPIESACIFWEGETAARYISMYAISRRNLIGFNASGMRGPMPNIEESSTVYGGPIIIKFRISQISGTGIEITRTIQDGDEPEHELGKKISFLWSGKDFVVYDDFSIKAVHNADGIVDAVEVTKIL